MIPASSALLISQGPPDLSHLNIRPPSGQTTSANLDRRELLSLLKCIIITLSGVFLTRLNDLRRVISIYGQPLSKSHGMQVVTLLRYNLYLRLV
jgi:hypothetical protein